VDAISKDPVSLVAGKIEFITNNRPRIAELYDSVSFLQHDHSVEHRGAAFTANLFVLRSVFEEMGYFKILSGWNGDACFTARASETGHRLIYSPKPVIHHPARSFLPLMRKAWRIGYGQGLTLLKRGSGQNFSHANSSLSYLLKPKPHFHNLLPWVLSKKFESRGKKFSNSRFIAVWLLGYLIVGVGMLGIVAALPSLLPSWPVRPLSNSPA